MTDNGLAALTARLERADFLSPNGYPTAASFAAAILRNGAVFLPEGLAEEWDWRQERDALMGLIESGGATIAALRAALDGLVEAAERVLAYGRVRPFADAARDQLRAALAKAKETP